MLCRILFFIIIFFLWFFFFYYYYFGLTISHNATLGKRKKEKNKKEIMPANHVTFTACQIVDIPSVNNLLFLFLFSSGRK